MSEEFHRLILDNVADLVAVIDARGQRLYNNQAYRGILGEVEKLEGTDWAADVHPEDREKIREVFRQTVETCVGQRAEFRFLAKDGSVRYIESKGNVIRGQTGRASKIVVVSRDITGRILQEQSLRAALAEAEKTRDELKAAEQRLLQSERLEAISTFAATIAHEIKNPLQTIVLGLDYLTDHGVSDGDNGKMLLEHMAGAVQRCEATIGGLVEFSSYNKKDVRLQSLGDIIRRALRAHETDLAQRQIGVTVDFSDDLPLLRLDSRSIKHVLISLIAQAAQGLPPGSGLKLRTFHVGETEAPQAGMENTRVVAEIASIRRENAPIDSAARTTSSNEFTLLVSRKVIELYGGSLECSEAPRSFILSFKT